MWEYKIKEAELGYIIYKINDDNWVVSVLYRTGKERNSKRRTAKEYIFQNDAISSLIVAKMKWESEKV